MKLLLITLFTISAFAADRDTVVLTPADREPAHLAVEALLQAQAQFLQLQLQLPELAKSRDAEIAKLKSKCGGDVVFDAKGMAQCPSPKPAETPAK